MFSKIAVAAMGVVSAVAFLEDQDQAMLEVGCKKKKTGAPKNSAAQSKPPTKPDVTPDVSSGGAPDVVPPKPDVTPDVVSSGGTPDVVPPKPDVTPDVPDDTSPADTSPAISTTPAETKLKFDALTGKTLAMLKSLGVTKLRTQLEELGDAVGDKKVYEDVENLNSHQAAQRLFFIVNGPVGDKNEFCKKDKDNKVVNDAQTNEPTISTNAALTTYLNSKEYDVPSLKVWFTKLYLTPGSKNKAELITGIVAEVTKFKGLHKKFVAANLPVPVGDTTPDATTGGDAAQPASSAAAPAPTEPAPTDPTPTAPAPTAPAPTRSTA